MRKLLIIILLFNYTVVFAQDKKFSCISCIERFYVMYRDTASDVDINDKYYIGFENGFNDTLEVYLNGALMSKGLYKTDPSLGSAGMLSYRRKRSNKKIIGSNVVISVKNISQNRCLEFFMDTRFKIVYINFDKNWGISYSNKFTIYE